MNVANGGEVPHRDMTRGSSSWGKRKFQTMGNFDSERGIMSDRMGAVHEYKSNEAIWCITRILDMNVVESGAIIDADYSIQPHEYMVELDSQGEQIVMTSGLIAYTYEELKERVAHAEKGA